MESVEKLITLANAGDKEAAYSVSQIFKGDDNDIDEPRYQLWIAKAASMGNPLAKEELQSEELIQSFEELHPKLAEYLFDHYLEINEWPYCFLEHIARRADNSRDGKLAQVMSESMSQGGHGWDEEDQEHELWLVKSLLWGNDQGFLDLSVIAIDKLLGDCDFEELIHHEFLRHNPIAESIVNDYWKDEEEVDEWYEERGETRNHDDRKKTAHKRSSKKKKKLTFFDKTKITIKKIFK